MTRLSVAIVTSVLLVATAAGAATIDDFSTPQTLSAATGTSVVQGTATTGAGSLGGARTVIITRDSSSSGSDSFQADAGGPGAQLTSTFCCSAAIWTLSYVVPAPVDITEGGTVDRFRFSVQASAEFAVTATLLTSDTAQSFGEVEVAPSAALAEFDIPFASMQAPPYDPPDLQRIARVVFGFAFFSTFDQPLTAQVAAIRTVPEPGGVALALLAFGALWVGSRLKRPV